MNPMFIVIIFLLIFTLVAAPFIVFIHVQEKIKNQHLETRLKLLNQLGNSLSNHSVLHKEGTRQHRLPQQATSKFLLLLFLPLPPLATIFMSPSIYSAFMSISIYFLLIVTMYFLYKRILLSRYKKSFIRDLPNAVDLIIRSLRAGRTITDSLKTVGEETTGPVAEQFRNIVEQINLGKDFISVVATTSKRVNIPDFSFFVIVLSVQQETGGNAIKTLSSLANMLRQRQLMKMKVKALSSEGVSSAFFMGGLPIFCGGIIWLMRPDYLAPLFFTQTGHYILISGLLSEVIGCIMIMFMVKIEV